MSKVVQNPVINRVESQKKYTRHQKQYNQVQEKLSSRLRDTHQSLFCKLVEIIDAQFRDANKQDSSYEINTELGIKVSVSSFILAKFLNCAPSTIRLRIHRLKASGVILRTINHGKLRPVDLFLNPRFLEIIPISNFFASTPLSISYAHQNPNSAEVCSSQEHLNNKIMLRSAESLSEADAKGVVASLLSRLSASENDEESRLLREPTQEQNHFSQEHGAMPQGLPNQRTTPEQGCSAGQNRRADADLQSASPNKTADYFQHIRQQEQDFRARIIIFATLFLSLAIDKYKFWNNRKDGLTIFEGFDRQPIIEYIADTYFSKCTTEAQLTKSINIYTARFEMVASYRRRKRWDIQWPSLYFDVNNPTGFAPTGLWYKKAQDNKARKESKKQKITNNERLLKSINRLSKDPSRKMFERAYIFNKCPQMLPQFDEMVNQLSKPMKITA